MSTVKRTTGEEGRKGNEQTEAFNAQACPLPSTDAGM